MITSVCIVKLRVTGSMIRCTASSRFLAQSIGRYKRRKLFFHLYIYWLLANISRIYLLVAAMIHAVGTSTFYHSRPLTVLEAYLQTIVHRVALCDRCIQRIVGEWFHCAYCAKDLCDACEAMDSHDASHLFVVFKSVVDMTVLRYGMFQFACQSLCSPFVQHTD
jgi:hypothetical protein